MYVCVRVVFCSVSVARASFYRLSTCVPTCSSMKSHLQPATPCAVLQLVDMEVIDHTPSSPPPLSIVDAE